MMKTYEDGLTEVWRCAQRLILPVEKGGLPLDAIEKIFDCGLEEVFVKYSAVEVIKKIKDWEGSTLEVGDEVQKTSDFGIVKAIITNVSDNNHYHILYSGKCERGKVEIVDERSLHKIWTKTGRHFDIHGALDAMEFELKYLKTDD